MDDNYAKLGARLNRANLIVAFNQIGFDNKLLRASGVDLRPDTELPNFDMLAEGRKAMGWDPSQRFPAGCKLDNFLEGTFGQGFMKTSHGEEAPRMWREGRLGELLSYCLADVVREKALFEYIWETGVAFTPAHGCHQFPTNPRNLLCL
jgi:DEAD/DEAH box helicase domain-containing protein